MFKRKSSLLLAASFLFAAPAAAQTAPAAAPAPAAPAAVVAALPDADPAIWVVKDPDTTIYLFGTFHALDGKSDWFNEEVKTAFDQSGEVVLELPPMEDKAALQPVIMKYALDTTGKPLSEKLSPEGKERLAKALAGLGAPPTAFDKFRPFFATLTVVMAGAQKIGFTGESGAEAILTKAAKASNKPISGLETIDYQMGLFANMSEADQITMLEETLKEIDQLGPMFAEMNKHWTSGDADGMAKLMNDMNVQSPAMYKTLLVDRNVNWAEWIDKRLDKPGVVFMGVGAGHLGGKDSVQAILAKRGIKSARIAAD
jgi:uncharacterized protein YbaP (TraB family)